MNIRLPKRENILKTGKTDPIHRHFHPIIRYFMNKRLEVILDLITAQHFDRLLDAGYGGGVFLPELSRRCRELYGIDIHEYSNKVESMLRREGIKAYLKRNSITEINFPDHYFDAVICLSVLEFIRDVEAAVRELRRVTRKDGKIYFGFPVENILTDLAFRLILINPNKAHTNNHKEILNVIKKLLKIEKLRTFPFYSPVDFALFIGCEAVWPDSMVRE